jgi:hypothetical protein
MSSQPTPGGAANAVITRRPPMDEILEHACRAPSVHNTQPWRWRVSADRVDLFADFRRQLVYADPARRDLVISCGAALHHLQVAAAAFGWAARVDRLPDPQDPRHLARVVLKPSLLSDDKDGLLGTIAARRTDRRRFTSWPVPVERLTSLSATGAVWGAQVLPVAGESARAQLYALTRRADVVQKSNHAYVEELAAWATGSQVDGIRLTQIPARDELSPADAMNRRFPNGALPDPQLDPGDSQDGLLLICTSSDDQMSRLRAGEALSAVWLHATRENMGLVPLSQAIEVDETRRRLQSEVLGDLAFPQLLLRVGWLPLSREGLPGTPRRPLQQVVERS